jgi:uncharacterized metal-binding protein YceD (DUF177 family)
VTPELSRPFAVARIGEGASFDVEAKAPELAAVARRMGLERLRSLACRFTLQRDGAGAIRARGALRATVVQMCVVTLEPFESEVAEEFAVRFVPEGQENEDIDIEAEDEIPYAGGTIDLGEAASEQLALALDPFPRKPGVTWADTGDPEEVPSGPLAALRARYGRA